MKKRIKLVIAIVFLSSVLYAEDYTHNRGEFMLNVPYSLTYGYMSRKNDTQIFAPYIGSALTSTKFSISYSLQTGLAIFHKNYTWRLEYIYNIVPNISFAWDYKFSEQYLRNINILDFNGVRLMSTTIVGQILTATHSPNAEILEQNAFTAPSVQQIISIDSQLFNDDFTVFTGMLNIGLNAFWEQKQLSIYFQTVFPLTFDFQHSKVGFVGSLFYTRYLSTSRNLIIGEPYFGYDSSIDLFISDLNGLYNKFYDLTGLVEFTYRIYFHSLPIPFDRFYIGLGANTGFGYDSNSKIDHLYMGTLAFGYELFDTIPFELKLGIDQDQNVFFIMSVISPIAHRFDSNID